MAETVNEPDGSGEKFSNQIDDVAKAEVMAHAEDPFRTEQVEAQRKADLMKGVMDKNELGGYDRNPVTVTQMNNLVEARGYAEGADRASAKAGEEYDAEKASDKSE